MHGWVALGALALLSYSMGTTVYHVVQVSGSGAWRADDTIRLRSSRPSARSLARFQEMVLFLAFAATKTSPHW
jgi:hypothetical protein